MQTKLTLRLEEVLIQQAKNYAKEHGKSLSKVVADYFKVLTEKTKVTKDVQIAPVTSSLIGILDSSVLEEEDYKKYLEDKYL
jgi:hypothetical protein